MIAYVLHKRERECYESDNASKDGGSKPKGRSYESLMKELNH